jgi:protein-S-isoprenylcysteine O-methyltransferase Ste14
MALDWITKPDKEEMPMLRIAIFLFISAAITAMSRRSLVHPRSHGFWRFFAFELLACLILLNAPVWFAQPLSATQLISWSLGAASIALAIEGFRLLRMVGKPSPTAGSATDMGIERTTRLVTVGAYRYIRHPLYSSLVALTWCAFLKRPLAAASIALAMGVTGFLVATAVCEERENRERFGTSYRAYMKQTRRFIPFLF